MSIKKSFIVLALTVSAALGSSAAFAVGAGLCNTGKQYICCPETNGWKVGTACNVGMIFNCTKDTGMVHGTNMTILQDCQKDGGSSVMYPF